MIFGPVETAGAAGAILAHGVSGDGWAFKKGRVLSASDVLVLMQAGIANVVVARLEERDLREDEAAATVAAGLAGTGVTVAASATGRANLFAAVDGVLVVDADRLDRVNAIDEAITVATLPQFARVRPAQMVATVKIIPFAAPRAAVTACSAAVGTAGALQVASFRPARAGLIQTRLPGTRSAVLRKTEAVTTARLAALGSVVAHSVTVAHDIAALQVALALYVDAGLDPILIFGASATVDRRDVLPSAIVAAGGVVQRLGMPVDPGNLLLLGRCGDAAVIGMPGCARSPKLNGLDWVLQRMLAGLPVDGEQIVRMGVGGLLTEIDSRPAPREPNTGRRHGHHPADPESGSAAPKVAAIVLAAGKGTRMPGRHKLLIEIAGRPMIAAVVDAAVTSEAVQVDVVVGHGAEDVTAALAGRRVRVIGNPHYASGLSSSIRTGLEALPDTIDGALMVLGDMPEITSAHLNRLVAAFAADPRRPICVPVYAGRRGNPVLWPARMFAALRGLEADQGGRILLQRHADAVLAVPMPDAAVLSDVDAPADLSRLGHDEEATSGAGTGPDDGRASGSLLPR